VIIFLNRQSRGFIAGRKGSILDRFRKTRNALTKLNTQYKSVLRNADRISSKSLFIKTFLNYGEIMRTSRLRQFEVNFFNHRPDNCKIMFS